MNRITTAPRGSTRPRLPAALIGLAALVCIAPGIAPGIALAGEARVAVAANFIDPAREIGALFSARTGHAVVLSVGSTGQLYAQISQGAPFDVLLAADQRRPRRAVDEGLAVRGSQFTYATGRLVLFSRDEALVDGEATLRGAAFDKLAVANPNTAPYGAAAIEVMRALGVYEHLADRIVLGTNIAQAFQFVETRNAELGFVAFSQLPGRDAGSRWVVPDDLHAPIAQDSVLLEHGASNPAALAFVAFLRGPEADAVKRRFGYRGSD